MAYNYNENKVQGFYYDHQLYNPLYTITLHPNTRPFLNGSKVDWKEGETDSASDMIIGSLKGPQPLKKHYDTSWDSFFTNGFSEDSNGNPCDGLLPAISNGPHSSYYAEPICSSIFTEDFNFNISNEWTSWDGGNMLENVFKSLKPHAPLIGLIKEGADKLDPSRYSGLAGYLTGAMKSVGDFLGSDKSNLEDTLNKALYIQGTRYSLYNGTSTQFGNMTMKFTLLSDWKPIYPGSTEYHFLTVYDQFNYIYPYCTGFFEKGAAGIAKGFIDKIENDGIREVTREFVEKYIGWQSPPGGFKSINRNIDVQQLGTLRLMLGGYYTIDNLVIRNININVSRQMCKCPIKDDLMVPLYMDVVLELQPSSVYTDICLGRFLNNSGMHSIHKKLAEAAKREAAQKDAEIAAKKREEEAKKANENK